MFRIGYFFIVVPAGLNRHIRPASHMAFQNATSGRPAIEYFFIDKQPSFAMLRILRVANRAGPFAIDHGDRVSSILAMVEPDSHAANVKCFSAIRETGWGRFTL